MALEGERRPSGQDRMRRQKHNRNRDRGPFSQSYGFSERTSDAFSGDSLDAAHHVRDEDGGGGQAEAGSDPSRAGASLCGPSRACHREPGAFVSIRPRSIQPRRNATAGKDTGPTTQFLNAPPLLRGNPDGRRVYHIVVASDRGLCGGFNHHLMRRVQRHLQAQRAQGQAHPGSWV